MMIKYMIVQKVKFEKLKDLNEDQKFFPIKQGSELTKRFSCFDHNW